MKEPATTAPPLSQLLPALILGGAGFSYQSHKDPSSLPLRQVIKQAFDQGMRAIDTSPFYDPSEQLFGEALASDEITSHYTRQDYILMTKVGRVGPLEFDYSPEWVQQSVMRSLKRLNTSYLDVVFCHDMEFVTDDDVMSAVGKLLEFVEQGIIKYIGLSSYRMELCARRARLVHERYSRPIDVVQTWGQLTLQNSRLETEGLQALRDAGVTCICSSSPLAIGLLRQGGVPQGRQGDFHPAPAGLRKAAQDAAHWVASQDESLAALALRYALWRAHEASDSSFTVRTITGITTLSDLDENVAAAKQILRSLSVTQEDADVIDQEQLKHDKPLFDKVGTILGEWQGFGFTTPPEGWSQEEKRIVT